jgi:sulfatase maturation enzyme AslB (radical SAM superfamily)
MKNKDGNLDLPTETFCILPWLHLYAQPDGRLAPCCLAGWDEEPRNRSKNQASYMIYDPEGIEENWNSPAMRELRLMMLADKRSPVCRRCYLNEDVGIPSLRQFVNFQFGQHIAEAVASTSDDGASPSELIRSIDLRLGNLCNLRCRMCSPLSSKALIGEWVQLKDQTLSRERLEELRHLDWFNREDFWRAMEKYVPHMELLHFTGGEPLLITQMFDFLERVKASGHASNITLSYVTNLTVLPRRVLELWAHFKDVRLAVSLDGFGEVNSFIRYPSHWPTIDRNLKELDAGYEQFNITRLMFNITVQVYNIFRLDEVLEYAATSFAHLGQPSLSLLRQPAHFDIRILPAEMKEQAAARLRNFTERMATRWPAEWQGQTVGAVLSQIEGIIEHMMSADHSRLIPEFRRWCEHQDGYRGQHVLNVIPDLAPLFESAPTT